jgi:hypothetical protein
MTFAILSFNLFCSVSVLAQQNESWKASQATIDKLSKNQTEFNYVEEKVPAYTLPEVLTTGRNQKITSKKEWEKLRRPELLELFTTRVYGRVPNTPYKTEFKLVKENPNAMNGAATLKLVDITITANAKSITIHLGLFIPNKVPKPVPAFLLICNRPPADNIDFTREKKSEFWPAEEVIARGYAVAAFYNGDVDPDQHDNFRNGIHGLLDTNRTAESWGTLAAWAWGASRCMDYLVTDKAIAADKVAVIGHSRGGKTALWAGATDERFAMICSNEAGCGGSSLARRKYGETIDRINKSFPHWFCENYKSYNNRENEMPVDMHELMALIAPRALYVAAASEDLWADPKGQYLALYHSLPVYQLYSKNTRLPQDMPALNTPVRNGQVAYHVRDGAHNLSLKDWNFYMDHADVVLKSNKANGYKGIWFTLGQFSEFGDKYSGGLGTYTANHVPMSIYAPEVKKTFFTYGGTTAKDEKHLLIMVSYYDHKKGVVPKPVIVYDKVGVNDPHDNASISLDDKGFLWVFVSGRGKTRPGFIFRSRQPYSIESFEQIKEGEMTYPQPWWMDGKGFFYLFTKYTKGRELYWTTSPDGKTWAADQKLAGMGGHYQTTNVWKGKLYSAFNYHPGGNVDKRTNIYVVQTDDNGKIWKTVDGKALQTPLTNSHCAALVHDYEAEKKLVYINDLNFDSEGNPVILAVISKDFKPGPQGDPREWTIIHWKDGKWNFSIVCTSTHNYDMGSLYIENKVWRIVGPTEAGPQKSGTGGEMALWESFDEGKSWEKVRNITQNSVRNHSYARRPLNAHPDFYAFWADGNADQFSESKLYFCNRKGDKVRVLPYDMKGEFAKPERVK